MRPKNPVDVSDAVRQMWIGLRGQLSSRPFQEAGVYLWSRRPGPDAPRCAQQWPTQMWQVVWWGAAWNTAAARSGVVQGCIRPLEASRALSFFGATIVMC